MSAPRVIGFDGDDTLWHSEIVFVDVEARYRELVQHHVPHADVGEALLATERRNLGVFGYGIKGFVLSMIETAIELTGGRITSAEVATIVGWGKEMLAHPVELLDGVAETVELLGDRHRLLLITKGDLFHQETKVARSGLAERFDAVEIVSEKDPSTYARVLDRHAVDAAEFLMVGNSVRSDVLPVIAIGGRAVHVPYVVTWDHEHVAGPAEEFPTITSLAELPALVEVLR